MRKWMALALLIGAPGAASAQTLPDALASAYASNPTLQAARAAAKAAGEGVIQARAGYLPSLSATASLTERSGETTVPTTSGGSVTTESDLQPQSVGVQATQVIYSGGRRGAVARAAKAGRSAAEQQLRGVEQSVLLQTISAYVDVRRDLEVVRIQRNGVDVLAKQVQAARDRFKVGENTLTDVAFAEARLAGAEASLAAALAALEATRARYAQVIGATPESLAPPPAAPKRPESLDAAVDFALSTNPDLAGAREAERIAAEQVRIQAADGRANVALVGRWDRQEDAQGPGVESDATSATAQVSVPIFTGGLVRSRTREAKLNLSRARDQVEEARRGVVSGVTATWNQTIAAERVIVATREQARAAELRFRGAQAEFEAGTRTTLDVLDAQQEALEADLAVVRAERDAYVAEHALLQAVGGLDPQTLGLAGR